MSEPSNTAEPRKTGRDLADAVREARNAAADRQDVVVDLREGQLTRLEMLADALQSVIADIPDDDERFDFAVSVGTSPRLWIDAVAHVAMGRDRRTYRFLRDTQAGRVVLAETADLKIVADRVTTYVAERLVERQRELAGETIDYRGAGKTRSMLVDPASRMGNVLQLLGLLFLGGLVGAGVILALAWWRFAEVFPLS